MNTRPSEPSEIIILPGTVATTGEEKRKKSRWWLHHPVLEGAFGLTAAIAAWAPPFSNSQTALTLAVIGILFAVARYGIQQLIQEQFVGSIATRIGSIETNIAQTVKPIELEIQRIGQVFDLTSKNDLPDLRQLIDSHFRITDPEFQGIKLEIVRSATNQLTTILNERRSDALATGEYYSFLSDMLNGVRDGETLYAVSTGESAEWDDSPQENRFFALNKEIVARGGKVVRYFVYERAKFLKAKDTNVKIAAHFDNSGLIGYFVDKASLQQTDPRLFESIGQGFVMIERRIAVVDLFSSDHPRGYVTKNNEDIDRFSKAIRELRQLA